MCFLVELGVDSFHVMIVHKVIQLQTVRAVSTQAIKTLYRMCDFKVIMIIVPGIQSLMKLIIGDRVEGAFVHPSVVVPVDDLAHQPEFRLYFICHMAERLHIFKIQYVQPDSVHVKFLHPEADDIADIITNRGIMLV